jgi:hypothetical protein
MAGRTGYWQTSFRQTDSFAERSRALNARAGDSEAGEPCKRGNWCAGRTVALEDGERVVHPRRTYRAYCDQCESYLAGCVRELAELYQRLEAAIGDPLQAEVHVPSPFGPQLPLREDIDAHMRLMAILLPGWEARVRATARLSQPDPQQRVDTLAAMSRACTTLATHATVLLALQPAWMTRTFRRPLDDDTAEWLADSEIVYAGEDSLTVMVQVGGEHAGQEIQYLHYRARSVLMETNPPPEILIPPCRKCEMRTLRRAWPEAGSELDLYCRCTNCRDEMTAQEYDVNAKRWLAYHKANASAAVLLEAS